MNIIHISDLHKHQDPIDNVPVDDRLVSISTKYPDCLLITTGDITDDGSPEQYENAKNLPGLKVPGNHDYGYAGNFYEQEKAKMFDLVFGTNFVGTNEPKVDIINNICFIGLDSNLETDHPFDFACGEIGRWQLCILNNILESQRMPTVIYLHHHPFVRNDPFMELRDAREFMRIIYGRVDVLLFGHKHVEQIWYDTCGIKLIHAAGKLADSDHVLRIKITKDNVLSQYVEI